MNAPPEPEDEIREVLVRLASLFEDAIDNPELRPQVLPLARKELAALERLQEQDPSKVPKAVVKTTLRRIGEHAAIRLAFEMMRGNILDRLPRPPRAA